MSSFYSITIIFLFLAAGIVSAKLRILPDNRITGILLNISLYMLLFFMGYRIGNNEEVWKALYTIGMISVAFAFATASGTIFITALLYYLFEAIPLLNSKNRRTINVRQQEPVKKVTSGNGRGSSDFFKHVKEPLGLAALVAAGFTAGTLFRQMLVFPLFTGELLSSWLLNLLLFLVGAQLVRSNVNLKETLVHKDTLLLPAAAVIGSLMGGLAAAPLFGLSAGKALALASGFGWYSLSGVLITDMGDPILGSAGFLINIFREGIALMIIPFLARTRYPYLGIGVAGATSMDVTLPLIEKSCGDRAVPLAISNGAILSLSVPILVPLFYQLG